MPLSPLRLLTIPPASGQRARRVQSWRLTPSVASVELEAGRERAQRYLLAQSLEQRTAADGRLVGIQSTLSPNSDGSRGLRLYDVLDGMVTDPSAVATTFADDPLLTFWQRVADEIQTRLGFPLEPELFSNMVVTAMTGHLAWPELDTIRTSLLRTFNLSDVQGLYHFFTSLRFACDTDCTGMAVRARLAMGDLDLETDTGRAALRRSTDQILRSAAVQSVSAEDNASYGKSNGVLFQHVFKVYLDDHEFQGAQLDRGLKNNPVVSVNALLPVLVELSLGLRSPDEVIELKEYPGPQVPARQGQATVAELVGANLAYTAGHLLTGGWRTGCRYYRSPDAYLCFYADLVCLFPEVDELFGVREVLLDALAERRESREEGIGDPTAPLNLAMRAIAIQDMAVDAGPEQRALLAAQDEDGGFRRYSPLYGLGTTKHRMYFGSAEQTAFLAARALSPEGHLRLHRGPSLPIDSLSRAIWAANAGA